MKKPKIKKKVAAAVKRNGKKNFILITLISLGIIVASAILAFALFIIITSPDFVPQELYNKEATVIYANDGVTEIARMGNENVELVTYDDLPEVLIDALIATEDSRFYQHNGFDAARFFKATMGQLAGRDAGGASTLSMQLMKNRFNGSESAGISGIIRKFKDIYMAVFKLEAVYTKEEIIEFYLNSQWLAGGSTNYTSITGVEQGSRYFFGKSVSDLSLAEASLLVGMFNNPSYYNPYTNKEAASERRSVVLGLMVRHGYITDEEREFAENIPVESLLVDRSKEKASNYQAFIDFLVYQVEQETGDNPFYTSMAIYSTLDPNIQDTLNQLENGDLYKFSDDKIQYGMAITDVHNGAITALSPGRNYVAQGLNRAVGKDNYLSNRAIKRQIGSTAKPIFDYGPYIEFLHGSTGTIFIDEPWNYSSGGEVVNAQRNYTGLITMRTALVQSRNIPALQAFQQVAKEVGTGKIAEFAKNLGMKFDGDLYESAALGGLEVGDPLTMSAAYAAFARGGYYIEPYSFTKVVYLETEQEYTHAVEKTKVMSDTTAYMITDMLVSAGRANVGGNFTISGTDIGAKTGTTSIDYDSAKRLGISSAATPDHWLMVFSPDYCIGLWHGYDQLEYKGSYLNSINGTIAKKAIVTSVARKIFKTNSKFEKPTGVVAATIEKETYPTQLASEFTPDEFKLNELFIRGYEPADISNRFSVLNDPTNGKATYSGSTITISWDPISTPDAINPEKIEEIYNSSSYWKTFEKYKSKFYQERIITMKILVL